MIHGRLGVVGKASLSSAGAVRRGEACHGHSWQGKAGLACLGFARSARFGTAGEAWRGVTGNGPARLAGGEWRGPARSGESSHGLAGEARYVRERRGIGRRGDASLGKPRHGWHGPVSRGASRYGRRGRATQRKAVYGAAGPAWQDQAWLCVTRQGMPGGRA